MAILNGPSSKYESLIATSDALKNGRNLFTYELIKSRLLQENQRKEMRNWNNSGESVPSSSQIQRPNRAPTMRSHCSRRERQASICWDKFSSLQPNPKFRFRTKKLRLKRLLQMLELRTWNWKKILSVYLLKIMAISPLKCILMRCSSSLTLKHRHKRRVIVLCTRLLTAPSSFLFWWAMNFRQKCKVKKILNCT